MKVTIICNGIERTFQGEFDELYNRDWDEKVQDLLESAQEYENEK